MIITSTLKEKTGKYSINPNFSGFRNFTDFFKRQEVFKDLQGNILQKSDVQALRAYNAELVKIDAVTGECVTKQTAFYRTLRNASPAAQDMAANANGATVQLNSMTISSKAAAVGMKLLSTALNMGIFFVISEVINGLFKLSKMSNTVREEAQELSNEFKFSCNEISDYKKQIEELHEVLNDSASSIDKTTNARKNLLAIQDQLIEKYGTEAEKIGYTCYFRI